MPQINVAKRFALQSMGPDNKPVLRTFDPGLHEVDDATAAHPYVKANLVDANPQALPVPGTPAAATLIRQASEAAAAAVANVLSAAHNGEKAAVTEALRELLGPAPDQDGPKVQDVLDAMTALGDTIRRFSVAMNDVGARLDALEAAATKPSPAPEQPAGAADKPATPPKKS